METYYPDELNRRRGYDHEEERDHIGSGEVDDLRVQRRFALAVHGWYREARLSVLSAFGRVFESRRMRGLRGLYSPNKNVLHASGDCHAAKVFEKRGDAIAMMHRGTDDRTGYHMAQTPCVDR